MENYVLLCIPVIREWVALPTIGLTPISKWKHNKYRSAKLIFGSILVS